MHQEENATARRRAQLKGVAEAYFGALAKKDFAAIPYDDKVILRAPLASVTSVQRRDVPWVIVSAASPSRQ